MTIVNSTCGRGIGSAMVALTLLAVPAMAVAGGDGAVVRVTSPAAGRVLMEVADHTVAVRKEMAADRSVVTLTTARERLIVTVQRGVLSVSGPGGSTQMDGTDEGNGRLIRMLQESDAAAKARVLLARVTDGPGTFVGQSMLLTRGILEAGSGDMAVMRQHRKWLTENAAAARPVPQGQPRVIRASLSEREQSRGPGECWDSYQREASRIMDDFEDCTDDLRWYEGHKYAGCYVVYVVRAEGAMAWFIACNGGIPFSG